jgi:hypothetical protein
MHWTLIETQIAPGCSFSKRGNTMKLRELKNGLEEIIPFFSKFFQRGDKRGILQVPAYNVDDEQPHVKP